MNILALDTATERCSVAVCNDEWSWHREVDTARSHADLILTMIDEVLGEAGLTLQRLDGIAFGRGPGSFTGVRIGVSVAQGLALSADLKLAPVSNLAAVALQAKRQFELQAGARILVCMDARMREVYWSTYDVTESGSVVLVGREQVSAPDSVVLTEASVGVGTGLRAFPDLIVRCNLARFDDTTLPRAIEIAALGRESFIAGTAVEASNAEPVYLRDQVVATK